MKLPNHVSKDISKGILHTSADVQTKVHLLRMVPDAVVVTLDVCIEEFVWSLGV